MPLYLSEPKYPNFSELAKTVGPKLADQRLPYDSAKWDDEVMHSLQEQHPYLPNSNVKLSLNIKNEKRGYAVGNITIDDRVRLPVVIDNFHLKPFDMFMSEGELRPMTKESILSALQTTEFGTTMSPGQGESSDIFMTHSRPPFDGKYTFAMLSLPGEGSAPEASREFMQKRAFIGGMLERRRERKENEAAFYQRLDDHFAANPHAQRALDFIAHVDPHAFGQYITAVGHGHKPPFSISHEVVDSPEAQDARSQELAADGYEVHDLPRSKGKKKHASVMEFSPEEADKALSNLFGPDGSEYFLAGDERLKKLLKNTSEMSGQKRYEGLKHEGRVFEVPLVRNVRQPVKEAARILRATEGEWVKKAGVYKTTTPGFKTVTGMLFDKVLDFSWGLRDTPRFVADKNMGYSDGAVFVTEELCPSAKLASVLEETSQRFPASGEQGFWAWSDGEEVHCTEMVTVLDKTAGNGVFRVKTAEQETIVALHPFLGQASREEGKVYLPKHASFWKSTGKHRQVFGPSDVVTSEEFLTVQARGGRFKVAFYVDPRKQARLGTLVHDDLSEPKTANLLKQYFEPESVETVLNTAKRSGAAVKVAFGHVNVPISARELDALIDRATKTAQRLAPTILAATLKAKAVDPTPLRKMAVDIAPLDWATAELVKVATEFDEEDGAATVNQALDLNIVTPQAITKYVDGINLLERARQFLLRILLAARLGLQIDPDAARTAAFAVDEVIRDLQQLRNAATAD